MTRLTWLRIFAHALICIAVAYDKALRRADRRQRKRVEPRRPRPAERAAEGRDRYWLAPGLEAVG